MKIAKSKIEQVLKTLPIGYYTSRDISVTLENANTSYYDVIGDTIHISIDQLNTALEKLPETTNEEIIEVCVRTLLYHEVSHAILTPQTLKPTKIMNIFEDERIETILKDYYMKVNFKEFVKTLNDFHGEAPKSADEEFYQVVRYRVGESRFTNQVSMIIDRYNCYNRITRYVGDYRREVEELYKQICRKWIAKARGESLDDSSKDFDQTKSEAKSNAAQGDKAIASDAKLDELKKLIKTIAEDKDDLEKTEELHEVLKSKIENVTNTYRSKKIDEIFFKILSECKKNTARQGSAINAYSGIFDPRSTVRDDYKYFVQRNRQGHVKQFAKNHLNLFIDCSGSFYSSETIVNQMLHSLAAFEKKSQDFTFDLITCGMSEKLHAKNDRILHADGGNDLDEKIFEIFKKQQKRDCNVYNIVLFDGYAFTDSYGGYSDKARLGKRFGAFNTNNTTIISESSNQTQIENNCPAAHKIFSTSYSTELLKGITEALVRFSR